MIKIQDQEVKTWRFPSGETGININTPEIDIIVQQKMIIISLIFESNDDIINLCLVMDAIRRHMLFRRNSSINIYIPYLPYSRQDRACNIGESNSLKVVAKIIDSLEFDGVFTLDAHSDVTMSVFKNVVNIGVDRYIEDCPIYYKINSGGISVVAPDAGALKKLTKLFPDKIKAHCAKNRDEKGNVSLELYIDNGFDVKDKNFVIIDDICDGGATFVHIAEKLKSMGCDEIYLIVSHAFFSNGLSNLRRYFEQIYCVNLMNKNLTEYDYEFVSNDWSTLS